MMPGIAAPGRAHCIGHSRCCHDRYLDALVGLRESPFLPRCKQLTRLRLQAELYALTQVDTYCTRSPMWLMQESAWAPCKPALTGAS